MSAADDLFRQMVQAGRFKVIFETGQVLNLHTGRELKAEHISFSQSAKSNGGKKPICYALRRPRVVWLASGRDLPEGACIATLDGSKNYALSNLKLSTISEKIRETHQRHPELRQTLRKIQQSLGKRAYSPQAKLNIEIVAVMRQQIRQLGKDVPAIKAKIAEWAETYDIHKGDLRSAIIGRTYRHIDEPPVIMPKMSKTAAKRSSRAKPPKLIKPIITAVKLPATAIAPVKLKQTKPPVDPAVAAAARRFLAYRSRQKD